MPILTKAAAPVKGTATLFTLDKVALVALGSVAADIYFSIQAKWQSVSLVYNSLIGNQHEIVKFDATKSSPTSKFSVSARAKDVFQIKKIIIKDFDGGTFEVLRSELTTAEFDIDMTVVASGFVVWDITGPYTIQPNGGLTTTNTATYFNQYAPSDIKSGDFDITFTFASAPSHDAVAAMVTDSDSGYGFVGQYGNANIHYNNLGGYGFIAWAVGQNIFRMTRIGSTITMYLNGVVVGTTTYSGNLRPVISMHTADVLTSANIVSFSSIAIPITTSSNPIAWIPESNYTVESDGGMTSTNTQYQSTDAIIFSSTGISGSGDFELIYNINCPSLNFGPNPTSEVFLGFSGSSVNQFYGFYFPVSTNILINDQGVYSVPTFAQPILLNNTVKIIKVGQQLTIKWNDVVIYTGTPTIPTQITPCVRLTSTNVTIISSDVVGPTPFYDVLAKGSTTTISGDVITLVPSTSGESRNLAYSKPIAQTGKKYVEFTTTGSFNIGITGFASNPTVFKNSLNLAILSTYFNESGNSVLATFLNFNSSLFGIAVDWVEGNYTNWTTSFNFSTDRIGIAMDFDTRKVKFYRNGVLIQRPTDNTTEFSFAAASQIRLGLHTAADISVTKKVPYYTPSGYTNI